MDIYSHILDEVLEHLINKKSGIYVSIKKKFDVLIKCFES